METEAIFDARVGTQIATMPTKSKRPTTTTELFNYKFDRRVYEKREEIANEVNDLIIYVFDAAYCKTKMSGDLMTLVRTAVCTPSAIRDTRTPNEAKLNTPFLPQG